MEPTTSVGVMTPYAALTERMRRDPSSPLLTYRDLATGERMELSAASLGNAVDKTAGMLRDELDAEPGAIIGVHLPLHWQRVVWLGACAATSTVFAPGADPDDCDVLVLDRARLGLVGSAREDVLVSLAPFGLPDGAGVPPGVTEAAVAMRGHPDTFVPWDPPTESTPLLRTAPGTLSQGDLMARAAEELSRRRLESGARSRSSTPSRRLTCWRSRVPWRAEDPLSSSPRRARETWTGPCARKVWSAREDEGMASTTSRWSIGSTNSILSIGSRNSVLSIGSVGSALSIGSIGSFASFLSIGSFASAGSVMSSLSLLSVMSHRSRRGLGAAVVGR